MADDVREHRGGGAGVEVEVGRLLVDAGGPHLGPETNPHGHKTRGSVVEAARAPTAGTAAGHRGEQKLLGFGIHASFMPVAWESMPELPEAERARQQIERVLGREIVAVDDRDTYVCRPHAPGEIAAVLTGRRLTKAHRRGKFLWVETDDGGPDLGLHLGMAGRIAVDEEEAPRHWDRFALDFADGGRLALRDKRRLGRALIEPDFSHVGPDAAEVGRDVFRDRVGRGGRAR